MMIGSLTFLKKDGGSVASTNEVGTGRTENTPAEPT